MEEQEDIFEVEKILEEKIVDGEYQYLVAWKGYPGSAHNTWEPHGNLKDRADTAIKEFKDGANGRMPPAKKTKAKKRARVESSSEEEEEAEPDKEEPSAMAQQSTRSSDSDEDEDVPLARLRRKS